MKSEQSKNYATTTSANLLLWWPHCLLYRICKFHEWVYTKRHHWRYALLCSYQNIIKQVIWGFQLVFYTASRDRWWRTGGFHLFSLTPKVGSSRSRVKWGGQCRFHNLPGVRYGLAICNEFRENLGLYHVRFSKTSL